MKIAFIGAGQVSTALGLYFKNNGFEIGGYYSRSCKSTERAARLTHSHPYASAGELINDNQMIWITTPDDQIEAVVRQITLLPPPRKDEKLVLHASGAYPLSILNPLKENGYRTACAHPLLAFGDPVVA
ncbi:MAG: NAD(P)-binding domain-containing protein, partial [Petrimonas sp.]|nr:NAD(P)-binding domain-containing protein [Petrimonas sp.]